MKEKLYDKKHAELIEETLKFLKISSYLFKDEEKRKGGDVMEETQIWKIGDGDYSEIIVAESIEKAIEKFKALKYVSTIETVEFIGLALK